MPDDTLTDNQGLRRSALPLDRRRSSWSRRWMKVALDLLFPPSCTFCGDSLPENERMWHLCETCYDRLTQGKSARYCIGCGLRLPPGMSERTKCPSCPPRSPIARVIPLGVYADDLRRAVIRTKQFHEYPLAATLGALLAEELAARRLADVADVIVPVPKYWLKRVLRGTNTAEILAESLGAALGRVVTPAALRCRRNTRKQSLLGWSERQRNVRGSFRVDSNYDFRNANVLLVDDIMTTGATAREAARALRRAGARLVIVAVVARAVTERTR